MVGAYAADSPTRVCIGKGPKKRVLSGRVAEYVDAPAAVVRDVQVPSCPGKLRRRGLDGR